ncbi:MAG: hypothetical protein RIS36_1853 [Pseudomonadota bacterium]
MRSWKGGRIRAHESAVEQSRAGNGKPTLHPKAGEGHKAGKGRNRSRHLIDECGLIVQRSDNAREIEVLQVAESAVNDPKGIVRRGVAAGARLEHER